MADPVRKFGFRIQTRGGSVVENLAILGRDRDEAEKKLRQIYHHCTILEAKEIDATTLSDASDLEGMITLISDESRKE
jgi:hypothetical protein